MTIEDIIGNESKNTEFKEMLPKESDRFVKTIIGFANSHGGKMLVGIEDGTRKIVGVDKSSLFSADGSDFQCGFRFLPAADCPRY